MGLHEVQQGGNIGGQSLALRGQPVVAACGRQQALPLWRFYFRAYAGSIQSSQVVEFLGALLRHLPGKLLVLWDGAPIHRSVLVRDFVAAQDGRLLMERLPSDAAELNPVEYLWWHLKEHELGNLIVRQAHEWSTMPPTPPPPTRPPAFRSGPA